MDDFTNRHLCNWIERNVFEEDRAQFLAYATHSVNDDPTYDWNWPNLYRTFRNG